jgi:hypothetical protein
VVNAVALGHFAAAWVRNEWISPLFHENRSSSVSLASSMVMEGNLITLAASFWQLVALSGESNLRTFNADTVRRAQSLCLTRYSSLYCKRSTDAGSNVNSDLMISAALGASASEFSSMASLKRMSCPWTLECSLSRAHAASKHLRARRYFSVQNISTSHLTAELNTYSSECTPRIRRFVRQYFAG